MDSLTSLICKVKAGTLKANLNKLEKSLNDNKAFMDKLGPTLAECPNSGFTPWEQKPCNGPCAFEWYTVNPECQQMLNPLFGVDKSDIYDYSKAEVVSFPNDDLLNLSNNDKKLNRNVCGEILPILKLSNNPYAKSDFSVVQYRLIPPKSKKGFSTCFNSQLEMYQYLTLRLIENTCAKSVIPCTDYYLDRSYIQSMSKVRLVLNADESTNGMDGIEWQTAKENLFIRLFDGSISEQNDAVNYISKFELLTNIRKTSNFAAVMMMPIDAEEVLAQKVFSVLGRALSKGSTKISKRLVSYFGKRGVQGAGKAGLLTKFKDFANVKTWINTLDDVADASLLSKLDNLEASYFTKLDADLVHVTYGSEIKALLKESPDDLVDVWKKLKDDPAFSWELQKTGGSRWEKWSQREFFKDITAKGKGFETNVCLATFKNRSSAKYLELKQKFQTDFGKNLDDYDMYSQVQLKYDGDNYFVADQLFVKYKTVGGQQVIDDLVVIENKLSSTTPLTSPQATAFTKNSYTVRSVSIESATTPGKFLNSGQSLNFSGTKQWYKVHDGANGDIISGISKMN